LRTHVKCYNPRVGGSSSITRPITIPLIILILLGAIIPALIISGQGTTWSTCPPSSTPPPCTVTNDPSIAHYNPTVAQDQKGNVFLFWDQNPGIYYSLTSTGNIASNIWPSPTLYTRGTNYDVQAAPVALKNGTLILFFSSRRADNYDIYYSRYNPGIGWSAETRLTTSPASDQKPSGMQDSSGKIWASWTRSETSDTKIEFVDTNGNGVWDPGESIAYDSNGNGVYDTGEPAIAGTAPVPGTSLKFDARIGFVDSNGNSVWDSGEFVVYDPYVDAAYSSKLMYIDSNNNNVWDKGETIAYDADADGAYALHTGVSKCSGVLPPSLDCVIIGSVPMMNMTEMKVDLHIKFLDLNGDSLWEPGKTLVYDTNNNGVYDANEPAIAALAGDSKIKFIGSGTTWTTGNTVAYDSNNNGIYDGKIRFVDDSFTGHWVPGDTVVYHNNLNTNVYDLTDTVIYESTPEGDLGKPLKNDPGLRFINSTGSANWVPGEAVVYDSNQNSIYDGHLMFVKSGTNTTWVPGEAVVNDADGDGTYMVGRYVSINDTIVVGTVANNTALTPDPKVKFYDTNDNTVWDPGEPVLYDTNNNNLYDAEITIAAPVPTPGAKLKTDPKLTYVQTGTNTTWVRGETVIYDTSGTGRYVAGRYFNDTIVAGVAPQNNTALHFDPIIKYVNATTGPSETWGVGKSVVYDSNNNNLYNAEFVIAGQAPLPNSGVATGLGEQLIVSGSPLVGSTLKVDPKIKYYRTGTNTTWVPGETVVYDSNGNGVYDTGEPVVIGTPPPQGTAMTVDSKVKYFDSNGNGVWDSAETIVYDENNNGIYDFGEYTVRGIIPQSGTSLAYNIGEPWIAGTAPIPGTIPKPDPTIKFVDLNGSLAWDPGEPVEYDSNNNGIFDTGDIIIAGNPVPAVGAPMKSDELTLAGTMVASGTKPISSDPKLKFVRTGTNTTWVRGETVVYDTAGTGNYVAGKYFNDTIVAGAAPTNGTALQIDTKLKYLEQGTETHWDTGEPVFYDANNNGIYDANENIVVLFQAPSMSARLISDSHIKYFDANGNGHWLAGDSVVYDQNGNGIYDPGETTLAGPVASTGAPLSSDPLIKFVNMITGNNTWARGEPIVYDTNNNNLYDNGEPVIVSSAPAPGTPLSYVTHIFYKTYSGGSWSPDQRLTNKPSSDNGPSIAQTEDGRIWIVWSGSRPGAPSNILKSTTDAVNWTPEVSVADSTGTYGDKAPSMTQDRNGTIWVVWSRNVPCSTCGLAPFESDLYLTRSTNNGATWAPATALTSTTATQEITPNISQLNDKNLYIFFTVVNCPSISCTVNISYFDTLIQMHSAHMNNFTTNATSSMTYGPNIRAGQVLRLSTNVSNTGDFADNFIITVKANSTIAPTNSSIIVAGQSKVILINWNTLQLSPGKYILTANVTVAGESTANLVDNIASLTVLIRPAGDANSDCKVNILDLVIVAGSFGKSAGTPGYNPIADLNNDGRINILDLITIARTFGETC